MKGNAAATILRWGLAFVFFYAAVASLRSPEVWVGFLPGFLVRTGFATLLLVGFSIYELILAVWLFTGRKLLWSSILAAITLAAITVANFSIIDVTFRDIGLAMAALALFELARQGAKREESA